MPAEIEAEYREGRYEIHLVLPDGRRAGIADEDYHALAAFSLFGRAFGFTWGDVQALRTAVAGLRERGATPAGGAPDAAPADEIESLIGRIAALLPPRDLQPQDVPGSEFDEPR